MINTNNQLIYDKTYLWVIKNNYNSSKNVWSNLIGSFIT
jgi:hypothetical protein